MANGQWTNRGKKLVLDAAFRAAAFAGTGFKLMLCTSAQTPTTDTNTVSELTEIANGNGYTTGGVSIAQSAVGFPSLSEDDTNDKAVITLASQTWTASGGDLPASGSGARWLILTDANATVGSRQVIAFWDLLSDRSVTVGGTISAAMTLSLEEC